MAPNLALLAGLLFTGLSRPAAAVSGFTGPFLPDSDNWSFIYTINDGENIFGPFEPDPAECPEDIGDNISACLITTDSGINAGNAEILTQNIASNTQTTAFWTWTNPSNTIGYYVSFDLTIADLEVASPVAVVSINGEIITTLDASNPDESISPRLVNPGQKLEFKMTSSFNDAGGYQSLGIFGFNGVEVPAPLPVAGAASAFGFSRRLRRRCRRDKRATGKLRVATPPPTYLTNQLNLPATSLAQLPLNFDYQRVKTSAQQRIAQPATNRDQAA